MDRRVALIVNPVAGGGRSRKRLPAVEGELRALGIDFHREETSSLVNAEQLAREATRSGEAVFTLGGDGLVGAVAGALAETGTPLGVLPGGRGNDFARVLGVPRDPAEAGRALARAKVRRLDLGEAGGRPFIGIASCGFDSDANRIANEARHVKGQAVYAYAALRALAAWKPARFELVLDADGDPVGDLPITVRIRPGAIAVLVP